MKKRSNLVIVFALLFVTVLTGVIVANTYAKYTATLADKTGTATVATWAFKAENDEAALKTFTISLDSTVATGSLVSGKIAPGTNGSFSLQLKNESSDVGVKFTIELSDSEHVPTNLVFKQNSVAFDPERKVITGYIAQGDTLNIPFTWEWAYETTNGDSDDTADGIAHETMTINAIVTAEQTNPSTTVTTGGLTIVDKTM